VTFTHRFGGEDEGVGHKEELLENARQSDTQAKYHHIRIQ